MSRCLSYFISRKQIHLIRSKQDDGFDHRTILHRCERFVELLGGKSLGDAVDREFALGIQSTVTDGKSAQERVRD